MYLNNETKRYEGNNYIEYQFASEGGFYIDIPQSMEGEFKNNPDGTITISARKIGYPYELVLSPTQFPVEPLSATVNLQMTNIVQAISVLAMNIGLIQSRKQIIHGVIFSFIHIRNWSLPKYHKLIKKIKQS